MVEAEDEAEHFRHQEEEPEEHKDERHGAHQIDVEARNERKPADGGKTGERKERPERKAENGGDGCELNGVAGAGKEEVHRAGD